MQGFLELKVSPWARIFITRGRKYVRLNYYSTNGFTHDKALIPLFIIHTLV